MQMLLGETLHPTPHSRSSRFAASLWGLLCVFKVDWESYTWNLSSSVAEADFEQGHRLGNSLFSSILKIRTHSGLFLC